MVEGAKAKIFQAIVTAIDGEHTHRGSFVSVYCYGGRSTNNKGRHKWIGGGFPSSKDAREHKYVLHHQVAKNVIKKTIMVEEYSDDWDPIWKRMNDKLNLALLKRMNLKHFRGKTLFLWERNHRC